jgi:glutamate 5-kinase
MRKHHSHSKRWLLKIGTSSLITPEGHFSAVRLDAIVSQAVSLLNKGLEVVLVSSGAIAIGMDTLKRTRRPNALPDLQACAAIGQGKLMRIYESAFSSRGFHAAQVLLTQDGLQNRALFVNAKNTINAILKMGAVPIINENDTVATKEIRFGDNDVLAAHVANMVEAKLLIFLSDIDGFYQKDKTIIRQIHSVRELKEYAHHVHVKKSERTAGGMVSKINAARVAMQSGISIVIANGNDDTVIERILKGEEVGSLFHPSPAKVNGRKKWLMNSALPKGHVAVDGGAQQALVKGRKSLLARGVLRCAGTFKLGDPINILDSQNMLFARGLTNYSCEEVEKIVGRKTDEIVNLLGYKRSDELIHRNNLVLIE